MNTLATEVPNRQKMNHVTVQAFRHEPAFRGRPQSMYWFTGAAGPRGGSSRRSTALAVTADEIVVERRVQVLDRLHPREWLVSVDEIHVEGVLGQPHAGCSTTAVRWKVSACMRMYSANPNGLIVPGRSSRTFRRDGSSPRVSRSC